MYHDGLMAFLAEMKIDPQVYEKSMDRAMGDEQLQAEMRKFTAELQQQEIPKDLNREKVVDMFKEAQRDALHVVNDALGEDKSVTAEVVFDLLETVNSDLIYFKHNLAPAMFKAAFEKFEAMKDPGFAMFMSIHQPVITKKFTHEQYGFLLKKLSSQ